MKAVRKTAALTRQVEKLEAEIKRLESQIKEKAFEFELWMARYRGMSHAYGTYSDRVFLDDPRLPGLVTRIVKLLPDDVPEELCQNP